MVPKDLSNIIENLDETHFLDFCSMFFDLLSKRYINTVEGVYHPDNRIVEIAQNKGIICIPAHFYSPVPTKSEIHAYNESTYSTEGIDWNTNIQLDFLHRCYDYQSELIKMPFNKINEYNFYWENSAFSHSDAAFYYSLIQIVNPSRILEVGAGNSTKLAISALHNQNQRLNEVISVIEPYPSDDLVKCSEKYGFTITKSKVQDVPLDEYKKLQKNDILFYDGSHVSKYGSDVNHFLFNVLPLLNKGVYVHIHDIFLPSEMPKKWLDELNLFWNEQYLVHAFLLFNKCYEIIFSSRYLSIHHRLEMDKFMTAPLGYLGNGGGSIWIRRI
jgi:hypothetical protein